MNKTNQTVINAGFKIQWKGKPSNYDTYAQLIFFSGNQIHYCLKGDRSDCKAPIKSVKAIYSTTTPELRQSDKI